MKDKEKAPAPRRTSPRSPADTSVPTQIRMDAKLHADFSEVAAAYGTNVSALARIVLEAFARDSKKYGRRLIYPPELAHWGDDQP